MQNVFLLWALKRGHGHLRQEQTGWEIPSTGPRVPRLADSRQCATSEEGHYSKESTGPLPTSLPGPGPFTCPPCQTAEQRIVIKDGKMGLTQGHMLRGKQQVWRGRSQQFLLARDREPQREGSRDVGGGWLSPTSLGHP